MIDATTITYVPPFPGGASRVLSTWMSERTSVKDFGAEGDGIANDAPKFQAAVNSVPSGASISLYVPKGTYLLSADVIENGRAINWIIDRAATFVGAGTLPTAISDNYGAIAISTAAIAVKRGLPTAAVTDAGAVIVAELHSSKPFIAGQANAAIAGLVSKHTTADDAVVQGAFFESIDKAGWAGSITGAGSNNFVEGVRAHGIAGATGGSGYGMIAFGAAPAGTRWKYIVGIEGEVNNAYANMPVGPINPYNFAASFLATSRGTKTVDAAFAVNPFTTTTQQFNVGFLVAGSTSTHTGFKHTGGGSIGLDLKSAALSYSAIRIPNNSAIHFSSTAGDDVNVMYMGTDNYPVFGCINGIKLDTGSGPKVVTQSPVDSAGAGFRTLRVPN